jgi:putative ABC transport system permease protein
MPTVLTDLRYAVRRLGRSPVFTLVTVATLAVGIGANIGLFGVVNALLLAPLTAREPGRLVRAYANRVSNVSQQQYGELSARNGTLSGLAAFTPQFSSLRDGAGAPPERVFVAAVSGNYFEVLGVAAAHGRALSAADDHPGAAGAIVLGHGFWQRRFGGDASIVGRSVVVDGRPHTVIGVLAAQFTGTLAPFVPEVFLPLQTARRSASVQMIGRLKPGVSRVQAQSELTAIAAQTAGASADGGSARMTLYAAHPLHPEAIKMGAIFASLLFFLVVLVLLIACVNLANLQLARHAERAHETAVRAALGAGRGRLVRELLAETVVLSAAGTLAALAAASAVARALESVSLPVTIPMAVELTFDGRVMAFTVVLAVVVSLLSGLVPALRSTRDALGASRDGSRLAGFRPSRLRAVLVTTQMAMSALLLVVGGLLVRSLANPADKGFDAGGAYTASLDLEAAGYTAERGMALQARLLDRLDQQPGIVAASFARIVPLTLENTANYFVREDPPASSRPVKVYQNEVSRGHFRALGIPLVAGRDFTARDGMGSEPVAIVNEALARRLWPGESALGRRLSRSKGQSIADGWMTVVGVARNSKYKTLGEPETPFLYTPLSQGYWPAATLIVKSTLDSRRLMAVVGAELAVLDPELPAFGGRSLDAATDVSAIPTRVAAGIAVGLGVVALVVAGLGIHGVIAHAVRTRKREIGIRVAIGASPAMVVRGLTAQTMRWILTGLTIGLILSVGVGHLLRSLLFGVGPGDPLTLVAVAVVLSSLSAAAAYLPARRAATASPLSALRDE